MDVQVGYFSRDNNRQIKRQNGGIPKILGAMMTHWFTTACGPNCISLSLVPHGASLLLIIEVQNPSHDMMQLIASSFI